MKFKRMYVTHYKEAIVTYIASYRYLSASAGELERVLRICVFRKRPQVCEMTCLFGWGRGYD